MVKGNFAAMKPAPAVLFWAAAIVVPIVLWSAGGPYINFTYSEDYEPFELFGMTASVVLLLGVMVAWRRARPANLQEAVPVILPTLVYFGILILISELSLMKSWDYDCYECAAISIIQGKPIYGEGYIYPPLVAQVLVKVHQTVTAAATGLGVKLEVVKTGHVVDKSWLIVYYLYQCAQYLLACLAFLLLRRLARGAGMGETTAATMAAALICVNSPLYRTLRHNQVNLWVLDLSLLAILLLPQMPVVAGLLIGMAAHIKLYPLLLLFPCVLARGWRTLAGAAFGIVAILAAQTGFFADWGLWRQFLDFARAFPKGVQFRDNGVHSLVYNTVRLVSGAGAETAMPIADGIVLLITLAVGAWFVARYVRRSRTWVVPKNAPGEFLADDRTVKLIGHSIDVMALMLLISPMAWEHHYILAMPVLVWACVLSGRERLGLIAVAWAMIFLMPTFDLYPLSYHRLAGLLLLVWVTGPRRVFQSSGSGLRPRPSDSPIPQTPRRGARSW